jgi:hypothetical protein
MSRIIAGALFDFLGFLTTREEATSFGSRELASPAVDLLKEWADTRRLFLDDADVAGWKASLASREGDSIDECVLKLSELMRGLEIPPTAAVPVTKTQISEAIFGWGLRNDDGHNLSVDDTDEIAEYIVAQALLSAGRGDGDLYGVGWDRAQRKAEQALLSTGKENNNE